MVKMIDLLVVLKLMLIMISLYVVEGGGKRESKSCLLTQCATIKIVTI